MVTSSIVMNSKAVTKAIAIGRAVESWGNHMEEQAWTQVRVELMSYSSIMLMHTMPQASRGR